MAAFAARVLGDSIMRSVIAAELYGATCCASARAQAARPAMYTLDKIVPWTVAVIAGIAVARQIASPTDPTVIAWHWPSTLMADSMPRPALSISERHTWGMTR